MMFSCKQCQKYLVAYIQRELKPAVQWRVARHLDRCKSCYQLYREHQQLTQDLRQTVPLIGNGYKPSFESLRVSKRYSQPPQFYALRYGLAVVVVVLMLIIPLTIGRPGLTLAAALTQPAPHTLAATPNNPAIIATVAFNVNQTPEPLPREIPSLDVINTP
jgi:predicted anti-sigma-YlaC factor YlaD